MSAPGTIEAITIDRWLFALLEGDAELRTILGAGPNRVRVAPWSADPAWGDSTGVTFAPQLPTRDVRVVGGFRVLVNGYYSVLARGVPRYFASVVAAASRIDELLHDTKVTTGDGIILACMRDEIINLPPEPPPHEWRALGGVYRIQVT